MSSDGHVPVNARVTDPTLRQYAIAAPAPAIEKTVAAAPKEADTGSGGFGGFIKNNKMAITIAMCVILVLIIVLVAVFTFTKKKSAESLPAPEESAHDALVGQVNDAELQQFISGGGPHGMPPGYGGPPGYGPPAGYGRPTPPPGPSPAPAVTSVPPAPAATPAPTAPIAELVADSDSELDFGLDTDDDLAPEEVPPGTCRGTSVGPCPGAHRATVADQCRKCAAA